MNTIALIVILSFRVLIPFSLLIGLGEWAHRREKHYWLPK